MTDTAAEEALDMAEVGVTMNAWEYRVKWMGEDEATARACVGGRTPLAFASAMAVHER